MDLITFLILVGVGFFTGRYIEKKHYQSIHEREALHKAVPAITAKSLINPARPIEKSELVYGNVVVSTDYFKALLAGLRNIFGGKVSSLESVLDRARREAILRLREMARGADEIVNLRLETYSITSLGSQVTTVEVFAYGTAVHFKR